MSANASRLRTALLAWYRRHARDLPWRRQSSVYATVVSEFMLQQTQVKTVLPYFERWMARFPDFGSLARAPADQVLHAWQGLGYYSRARNLHRLAQGVAAMPEPPRTAEAWEELPGIGPYTAAAISSIAFDHPAACVDGNVVRILARLDADGTPYRDSGSAAKAFAGRAQELLDRKDPGTFNQAMMELGATVCTKHKPQCLLCPVREFCRGARTGRPEEFPRLAPKLIEKKEVVRVWWQRDGALLLHRAPASSARLAGLHELPSAEQAGLPAAEVIRAPLMATKTRSITRFRIVESIHRLEDSIAPLPQDGSLVWAPLAKLDEFALSGPHQRWIRELSPAPSPEGRAANPAKATRPRRPREG